jgi:hypothetical protein
MGPFTRPYTADYSKLDLAKFAVTVQLGYGWVASSFRREGYGIAMSAEDTRMLAGSSRSISGSRNAPFIQGGSYGALWAAKVLETQARFEQSAQTL